MISLKKKQTIADARQQVRKATLDAFHSDIRFEWTDFGYWELCHAAKFPF